MSFDEADKAQMAQVAESIVPHALEIFPAHLQNASLKVSAGHQLESTQQERFLDILDSTIGSLYSVIVGSNWKHDKVIEMQETGLVFVWYQKEQEILGFVSFMLVMEHGVKKLYLYEIHIGSKYQHARLGTRLINSFHELSRQLDSVDDQLMECKGTSLTVFAQNERAHSWYRSLGYRLADDSPIDRTLRSGRVVKPSYYIMTRDNE